ncbi:uncharacterized protein LOC100586269 [Nomascus leucogenys]|uniref:uncharacterized protein LOC100586269 n=1 Tax=Nomascus leucogenys TaxID=61853 RepID=UPI00122D6E79|nr:uncharacterized protein LOC100586269 [Nomascus leucogenys]
MEPRRNQPGSWQVMEHCLSICELTTVALEVNKGNGKGETQPPQGLTPWDLSQCEQGFPVLARGSCSQAWQSPLLPSTGLVPVPAGRGSPRQMDCPYQPAPGQRRNPPVTCGSLEGERPRKYIQPMQRKGGGSRGKKP